MDLIKKILSIVKKFLILFMALAVIFWIFVWNYSFTFKYRVAGVVQAIQPVGAQTIIANGNKPFNSQVFSVSVAIKDLNTNEIHVASSEDRQWGAVKEGNCAVAAFFPYPPWRLDKGSTNHNARFLKGYLSCEDLPKSEGWFDHVRFFFLWY